MFFSALEAPELLPLGCAASLRAAFGVCVLRCGNVKATIPCKKWWTQPGLNRSIKATANMCGESNEGPAIRKHASLASMRTVASEKPKEYR